MAALVVEHPAADVIEVTALEMPAVHREGETVDEHDGDAAVVTVDLDVQRYPVVGDDGATGGVQRPERLLGEGVGSAPGAADRTTFGRDACSGEGSDGTGYPRSGADSASVHLAAPECTRGTRAPMRVTIS